MFRITFGLSVTLTRVVTKKVYNLLKEVPNKRGLSFYRVTPRDVCGSIMMFVISYESLWGGGWGVISLSYHKNSFVIQERFIISVEA